MRLKLPLLRARYVPPARAPILRYGVAVLSITLALIPALVLSDVVESRLVVFAVAIMVSAWYGGWKPGLVATSFALTVSAYFSLAEGQSPSQYRKAIIHLMLFVFVALLICSFNAALRSAQEGLRRSEVNFRSLVTNAPYGICRCDAAGVLLTPTPLWSEFWAMRRRLNWWGATWSTCMPTRSSGSPFRIISRSPAIFTGCLPIGSARTAAR